MNWVVDCPEHGDERAHEETRNNRDVIRTSGSVKTPRRVSELCDREDDLSKAHYC